MLINFLMQTLQSTFFFAFYEKNTLKSEQNISVLPKRPNEPKFQILFYKNRSPRDLYTLTFHLIWVFSRCQARQIQTFLLLLASVDKNALPTDKLLKYSI